MCSMYLRESACVMTYVSLFRPLGGTVSYWVALTLKVLSCAGAPPAKVRFKTCFKGTFLS